VLTFRLTIGFLVCGAECPAYEVNSLILHRSGNSSRSKIEATQKLKMVFKAGMAKSIKKGYPA